ncbi:hypothetical protein [Pseudomonas mangiferae]|uniref:Uncharacterized protein n=1 Tax=Pseudomonas mangiferae TaxID=2593654 RepID=A0A553H4C1_9PSED|nr:hypothetical protein [Pseudomonas mangiferae]TRX76600.1 hypothetical protein FM069_00835 [Pseudomonas mangiferae]
MDIEQVFDEKKEFAVLTVFMNSAQRHLHEELMLIIDELKGKRSLEMLKYMDPETRNIHFYGYAGFSSQTEEHAARVKVYKQFQWLLVDAYEAYERFLIGAYAAAGDLNDALWPLKDYGQSTANELKKLDFETRFEKAKN